MKRFGFPALACALSSVAFLGGCHDSPVQPVAMPAVHAEVQAAATTTVLNANFESAPAAALGAPWKTFRSGGSTATVMGTTTPHGKVLLLHGSTTAGDSLSTSIGFSTSAAQITSAIDIKPVEGASFIWSLHGGGYSISSSRIRLQRAPGSTMLVARTSINVTTNCGNLPNGVWSRVTLIVRTAGSPNTMDVRINGAATACTGISTGMRPPFTAVMIIDPTDAGYGRNVQFDNLLVTTP